MQFHAAVNTHDNRNGNENHSRVSFAVVCVVKISLQATLFRLDFQFCVNAFEFFKYASSRHLHFSEERTRQNVVHRRKCVVVVGD